MRPSRRCRLGALFALAIASLTGEVRAQTPSVVRPASPAELPARLQPGARSAIERIVDSAQRAGLPIEPLHAKAAEGVLKGADDARIVVAVRALARELGDARIALGADATSAELVAGASALHAGVPGDVLRQLRRAHQAERLPPGGLAMPLVVLADLVTRRVPTDTAAASVATLIARRAPDAELAALRASVEQDIVAGRSPGASVQSRTQAIVRTLEGARAGLPVPPRKPPAP